MLEVSGLRAGYGGTEVLRGIDMTVGAGEIVAVLGSNGVGKTTLNMALSGILRPSAGTVRLDGERTDGRTPAQIVAAGLVHVPEGRRVFPNLSIHDNLLLGSYRRGRRTRALTLDRVLATFPRLRERLGQQAGTLSGGEQQMLAIARGMMADPKLLILDEPSLGLSPLLVEEMFVLIALLRAEGLAIMLVEQNVVQSLELADRGYVLENGRHVMQGDAASLSRDPELRRTYLGL